MRASNSSGAGVTAFGRTPSVFGAAGTGACKGVWAPPEGPGMVVGVVTRSTSIAFKGGWRTRGWLNPHQRQINIKTRWSSTETVRPARFSCQRVRALWNILSGHYSGSRAAGISEEGCVFSLRNGEIHENTSAQGRPAGRARSGQTGGNRYRNAGSQSFSRPALPGAIVGRRWRVPCGAIRGAGLCRPQSETSSRRSFGDQAVSFRALRCDHVSPLSRRGLRAYLLHQDRFQIGAHLYRPAWSEGSGAR